jgi:Chalcone and stilbene synthases, N-terminal domain
LSVGHTSIGENPRAARSGPGVAIAAVASAVPEHCIDQQATRDIVLSIAPELRSHEGLFLNTGIRTRYSCVPLEWHFKPHGWAARNAVFKEAAADLLERVARECIDRSGLDLAEVEAIVTVSTTGLAVPSLDAILANRLGLPAIAERLPIFGLGCAGGVSGLARAARMAQSLPRVSIGIQPGPTKNMRQRQAFRRYAALRASRPGAAVSQPKAWSTLRRRSRSRVRCRLTMHTVRYTELSAERFKNFWQD